MKFSVLDNGELDEAYIPSASVHIERMDDACFWIGIEPDGEPMIHIRTGVEDGKWFFRIEEDETNGKSSLIEVAL